MNELIVDFLRQEHPDHRGRMISDIWRYSDEKLEEEHDYIQWLFPLFESSAYSPNAPILTINLAEQIIADDICKSSLKSSLSTMRSFYGNVLYWAKPDNHNLLRITRILKSSALLLGKVPSMEFYDFIMLRCNKLDFRPSGAVVDFWSAAAAAELAHYRKENC